jgi:hypothetical protein
MSPACKLKCDASPGNKAAAAAAVEAATNAVLAAAQQERQQVQLRLASLLCSCVKALAREQQQQQCSWGWVAMHCSSIAEGCTELAQLESAIMDGQARAMLQSCVHLSQKWRQVYIERVPLPSSLVRMLKHAYGSQLVELFNPVVLKLADDYSRQLKGEQLPAQIQPQHLNYGLRKLAAMLAHLPCMQSDSSSRSSSSSAAAGSGSSSGGVQVGSSTQQQDDSSSSSSSSSSGDAPLPGADSSGDAPLLSAEVEVQLAFAAALARAVRLHSTVLDAAFSHPCLNNSATDEARAAGAAQLKQQLDLAKHERLLTPLPSPLQQQFDCGDEGFLSTAGGAAAAIAAVLGDQEQQLEYVRKGITWVHGMSEQLLQAEGQQLHAAAVAAGVEVAYAFQHWKLAGGCGSDGDSSSLAIEEKAAGAGSSTAGAGSSTVGAGSSTAGAGSSTSHAKSSTGSKTLNGRAAWVSEGHWTFGKSLVAALQRWADAVCAVLPSRRCCSNPCCVVLREMAESNLVNGRGCCCGGCAAAGQAVRYCGRDCQASHWQQHKALCRSRRRQQQGQEQ